MHTVISSFTDEHLSTNFEHFLSTALILPSPRQVFRNIWKKTRPTAVHKAEMPHKRSNCGPISILPILSKLERHVANSYVKFITENNILLNCQHGFRANHSCKSTLTSVYEHILSSNEEGLINSI